MASVRMWPTGTVGEPTGAAPSGPAGPHGSAPSGTVGGANQYGSREPVRFAREPVRLAREPVRLADRMACLDRTGWLRQPYRTGSANQYRFSPTVPVGHIRTLAIHAPTLPSRIFLKLSGVCPDARKTLGALMSCLHGMYASGYTFIRSKRAAPALYWYVRQHEAE